jgi:hypothetical protein
MRKFQKVRHIIVAVLLSNACVGQTDHSLPYLECGRTAVVFIRNDTITVGADSKAVTDGTADTACRVLASNGVLFVHVGLMNAGGVLVVNEAKRILGKEIDIGAQLLAFEYRMKEFMETFAHSRSDVEDSIRHSNESLRRYLVDAVFCTFVNDIPTIHECNVHFRLDGNRIFVETTRQSYPITSRPYACLPIGVDKLGDRFIPTIRNILRNGSPETIVNLIIADQMTRRQDVGDSIDIVQLTRHRYVQWIHRKPTCKD